MIKLRLVYPVSEQELLLMVEKYRKEQIQLAISFFLIFFVILTGAGVFLLLPGKPIVIYRNDYGEDSSQETIYPKEQDAVEFTVSSREYTKEELNQAFAEGFSWVRKKMLNENPSAAEVSTSLSFMTEVPGGLSAEWISSNPDLLREDGNVCNDDWEADRKETVMVTLLLSCQEEIQKQELYVTICAQNLSRKEKLQKKIKKYISQEEEKTRTKDSFTIPAVLEGVKLEKNSSGKQIAGILILIPAFFILFSYQKSNRLKEQISKRQDQIRQDYPIFVNQLTLYLGAGMNLKGAFQKIAEEYQEGRQKGKSEFRYAYQELYVMMNQMQAGISEKQAYEAYGKRMGEGCYLKLMSLIVQNLQKGNAGLLKALSDEEERAFLKRLEHAKKLGEEAGTKLLFPMLILLIVVMVIVMVPAIFQFQGY